MVLIVCVSSKSWSSDGLWSGDLDAVIEKSGLKKNQYGIEVQNVAGDRIYFSSGANEPFNPASSLKLLISVAALEKWGPQNKFSTSIYKDGKNLCMAGHGDPSLVYEDLFLMVEKLLRSPLFDSNVENIIVDESFFPTTRDYSDDFEGDSQRSFTAPLSSLSVNYNSVTIFVSPNASGKPPFVFTEPRSDYFKIVNQAQTVSTGVENISAATSDKGSHMEIRINGRIALNSPNLTLYRAVPDPAFYSGMILKDLLLRAGAIVKGSVQKKACSPDSLNLVQYDSKPLSQIIQGMNKFSNNFIAETLLIHFGSKPTSASGLENLNQWLKDRKFPLENVSIQNSSGLSRTNSVTAKFLLSVLSYAKKHPKISPEVFASLPIGGLDGTLKRRFKSPNLQGLVRAKSGSLKNAISLVGSVQTPKQGELLFAFLFRPDGEIPFKIQTLEEKLLERLSSLGAK